MTNVGRWKKNRYSPIVMGIGTSQVHLLQMVFQGDQCKVSGLASAFIPTGSDRDANLRSAILRCLKTGDFKGKEVALCLKGEDLYVQHHRFSPDGKGDVDEKIRAELHQNVSYDLDQAEVRYLDTGKVYARSEFQNELILMVADRSLIARYITLIDKLKLVTVRVGVEPLGLMQAVHSLPPEKMPEKGITGFMTISASKTELIVIRDGMLAFTRSIPLGGDKFTRAIEKKMGVTLETALRLKRAISLGQSLNDTLQSAATSAFRPVVERIGSEICSCFRYFSSIYNRESVDCLVIAGEEVGEIVRADVMEKLVSLPVIPWSLETVTPGQILRAGLDGNSTGYISLVGLAMESHTPDEKGIDFMPGAVLEKRQNRRSTTIRIASLVATIFGLLLLFLATDSRQRELVRMQNLVESRSSMIHVKNEAYIALQEKEEALQERRSILRTVRPLWRTSRIVGEIARASGSGVHFSHFMLNTLGMVTNQEAPERDMPVFQVRIEGLARSDFDLNTFKQDLTGSGAFRSIRHEDMEDLDSGQQIVKRFTLTLTTGGEAGHEIF